MGAALGRVDLAAVRDRIMLPAQAAVLGQAALVLEAVLVPVALVLAPDLAQSAVQVPVAAAVPGLAQAAAVARVPADQALGVEADGARALYTVEPTVALATVASIRAKIPNPQPHLRVPRTVIENEIRESVASMEPEI